MQRSPMMREIERLPGNGDLIESRGRDIEDLGEQMIQSAQTLLSVKDADDGQHGNAVDSLRSEISEAVETLNEAGELYKPVGPRIAEYGEQVIESQPRIDAKVGECETLWVTYSSLPGSTLGPDSSADDEDAAEQEYETKKRAWDEWNQAAGEYDTLVSTWELAYDQAANGISRDMAGKVRDPHWFWDFIDGALTVLGWVSLAVGVLALIAGGPFVALAALLGAAIFSLTALQYVFGEASLSDMLWATAGILPFGKLGGLFRGNAGSFGKEMFRGFTWSNMKEIGTGTQAMARSFGNASGGLNKLRATMEGGFTGALTRALTGKDADGWTDLTSHMDMASNSVRTQLANAGEVLWQKSAITTEHLGKFDDWSSQILGTDPIRERFPAPIRVWFE